MIKKPKKLLVTTALKDTWIKGENIIFLGEWCKKYNEKHIWGKEKFKTIRWHLLDRKKNKQDHDYLTALYEKVLSDLVKKLNNIHSVNFSKRYWRIILGPWLLNYIPVLWDRWENLRVFASFNIKCETYVSKKKINDILVDDYSKANILMNRNDTWNYFLYLDILRFQNFKNIELVYRDIDFEDFNTQINAYDNLTKKNSFIYYFKLIVDRIISTIIQKKHYKFIIFESYFPIKFLFNLFYKLKIVPSIYYQFSKEINYKNLDFLIRPKFKKIKGSNKFEKFLYQRIFKDMPKTYLEVYKELSNYCEKLPTANIIYTSNAHFRNEIFKIWSAKQVINGSKLIIGQHGGAIPALSNSFNHEDKICDKKTVWHTRLISKHEKLSINKIVDTNFSSKNKNQITLVGLDFNRYYNKCGFAPLSSALLLDFNQKIKFINLLKKNIKVNLKIRPYQAREWHTKKRYIDIFGKKILSTDKTLYDNFKNSKLLICTYPQTTFNEAMNSGKPTIMLYLDKFWEHHPVFHELIVKMKKAQIIHSDPIKAAEHVNRIAANPKVWWYNKKTVEAKKMFYNLCGSISDDPLSEYTNFFNKINKEFHKKK